MRGVELIGPGRAGLFVNLVPIFGAPPAAVDPGRAVRSLPCCRAGPGARRVSGSPNGSRGESNAPRSGFAGSRSEPLFTVGGQRANSTAHIERYRASTMESFLAGNKDEDIGTKRRNPAWNCEETNPRAGRLCPMGRRAS